MDRYFQKCKNEIQGCTKVKVIVKRINDMNLNQNLLKFFFIIEGLIVII